ncbi:17510_t:CDS:2, partial [Cetraspora pellucida]
DCWYRDSSQQRALIWEWVTLFGWIDASILYCVIVIIMVIRKLNSVAKQIDALDFSSTSRSSNNPPLINKAMISSFVRRVIWYPVLPVAQIFGGFTETYFYINHVVPYPLILICFIGMSIQGLLNALVFSQDLAVIRTFQVIKLRWWISIVNSYESHYPHKSHSKAIALVKSNNFVELKALNCNNADIIKSDIINDDVIDNNIINEDINNKNFINKNNNIDNRANNSIVSQPSLLGWLKYMLLIKLFSPPSQVISSDYLSSINSLDGNEDSDIQNSVQ